MTSHGLDGPGFEFQQVQEIFIFSRIVQTESEAHPYPYSMGNGLLFRAVGRPRCDANHSSSSTAEVRSEWSYTSVPHTYILIVIYVCLLFVCYFLYIPFSSCQLAFSDYPD